MKKTLFFGIIVFLLAAAFLFYEMALQVSPSVMTHQLMLDFKINASVLGVMAAFYFYSYTSMQIPAGLLYDRFGPRLLITISLCICVMGAFLFGFTTTVVLASLGRFFMGIGSAFGHRKLNRPVLEGLKRTSFSSAHPTMARPGAQ